MSLPMIMKVVVFVHSKKPNVGEKRSLKNLFLVHFIPLGLKSFQEDY